MSSYIDEFHKRQHSNFITMDTTSAVPYLPSRTTPPIITQAFSYPVPPLELLQLSSDSDAETTETVSPAEKLTFDYRIIGLTWVTAPITNTCHMDSFLSAFVKQVRQTHGKFLNKITYADDVGVALIKIGEHSLQCKNSIDSTYIRMLWIEAVTQTRPQLPITSGGREEFSIFQHLDHHSGFIIEQTCTCGTQYMFESTIRSTSLHDIKGMLTTTITYNTSLLICADCQTRREFVKITPTPSNWLITVYYTGYNNPEFKDIEEVITLNNQIYKLGYLGYSIPGQSSNMGHFVSLQRIRGHWYKYRASNNPNFSLYPNDVKYTEKNAILETIVYFRV